MFRTQPIWTVRCNNHKTSTNNADHYHYHHCFHLFRSITFIFTSSNTRVDMKRVGCELVCTARKRRCVLSHRRTIAPSAWSQRPHHPALDLVPTQPQPRAVSHRSSASKHSLGGARPFHLHLGQRPLNRRSLQQTFCVFSLGPWSGTGHHVRLLETT